MTKLDCVHNLMKAISCYVHNDIRVWLYLYLACEEVRPYFYRMYGCDLVNALLGYNYVFEPNTWITQLLSAMNFGQGKRLFGYAYYGSKVDLNLMYSFDGV